MLYDLLYTFKHTGPTFRRDSDTRNQQTVAPLLSVNKVLNVAGNHHYNICRKNKFVKKKNKIDRCCDRVYTSGPVVQRIVSLTSSLKGKLVKCFTTL